MPRNIEKAVCKTLAYADIFDYPLTLSEIRKRLIGETSTERNIVAVLKRSPQIVQLGDYYFFEGREETIDIRKKRARYCSEKFTIAQDLALLLKIIPSVKMVGLSGALAIGNADKDDDIDFFIITRAGNLWTTRFLVTILIEISGQRLHPGEKNTRNKICLNMYLAEDHLTLPKEEQDLYSAYEVVQMKPLWDRQNISRKFIQANLWIRKYLPNSDIKNLHDLTSRNMFEELDRYSVDKVEGKNKHRIETFFKKIQALYMHKKHTSEIVNENMIRFHPVDARKKILSKFSQRFQILYSKEFGKTP